MANKVLNVLVSVQDDFSKGLDKLSDGLKNNEKMFKSFTAVGAGALTGIASVIGLSVKAYGDSERAQRQLEHAVIGVSKGTQEQVKQISLITNALEKKTGIDGDALKMGVAQLSTFGLQTQSVTDLAKSLADLTVNQSGVNASNEQYVASANVIQKALQGQFGRLEMMGIRFTEAQQEIIKFGTESEKVAAIQEGFAQNLRETTDTISGVDLSTALARRQFEELVDMLGASFAPVLENVSAVMTVFFAKISEWVANNPNLVLGITSVVAGFSALLFAIGSIGLLLPMIISGFSMLANPIGLAVVAIGLLTTALTYFYVTNETFRNIVNAVWDEVKIKIETVVSAISAFWQTHGTAIMNSAMLVWGTIRDVVSTTMWIIQEAISLGIQAIRWIWEEFGVYIQFATSTLWEFITLFIGGAINNVKIVLSTVLALIRGDWEGVWTGIKNILSNLWETMKGIVGLGIDTMVSFITGSGIASAFGGAWEAAKGAMMAVIDSIKGAVQGLMDWIIAKVQAIMGVLSGAVNAVKSLGSGAVNIAKRAVGVNDAIISPKGDIITTHPDDYLIATKDPHSLAGKGGITVNISGNTLLDSRGAEKIGELLMKELRRNVIPA
jgi:phage-related protein